MPSTPFPSFRPLRPVFRVLLASALALAAGCGSSDPGVHVQPPAPAILGFEVGQTPIIAGQSTTLTAYFTNGKGAVDGDVGSVVSGKPVTVTPTDTTTYVLTVAGAGGSTTATAKVEVVAGASLTVTLDGALPPAPSVTVIGPSGVVDTLTATKTIDGLPAGSYSVEAPVVADSGVLYLPKVNGAPAQLGTGGAATIGITYAVSDSPPVLSAVADQLVMPGQGKDVHFAVADGQDLATDLTVTVASGDTSVIPSSDLALSGTGADRTLSVTAPTTAGAAPVTLTVNDTAGHATSETFLVTIPAVVTTPADSGAGSLRAVVGAAATGETVVFDPSVTGQILLTSGAIDVSRAVTLVGPGARKLTLTTQDKGSVFAVTGDLAVSGLTFSHATQAITVADGARLAVTDCAFVSNTAASGAAIVSTGTVVVRRSLFDRNVAQCPGSSPCSNAGAAVHQLEASGGGLASSFTASDSTFTGNVNKTNGGSGAALALEAGSGRLTGCTIAANDCQGTSCAGGAVLVVYAGGTAGSKTTLALSRTIVAGNTGGSPADLIAVSGGQVTDGGDNVLGHVTGVTAVGSDAVAVSDPKLAARANLGGPTDVMVPLPGSPALDRVPLADLGGDLVDQRDDTRRADGALAKSDAGAVDRQQSDPTQ